MLNKVNAITELTK